MEAQQAFCTAIERIEDIADAPKINWKAAARASQELESFAKRARQEALGLQSDEPIGRTNPSDLRRFATHLRRTIILLDAIVSRTGKRANKKQQTVMKIHAIMCERRASMQEVAETLEQYDN